MLTPFAENGAVDYDGLSCIQGNFFPELITWLCRHHSNAALADEVARVQQFLSDQMDLMHQAYPLSAKYFLQKRGLRIGTFTRKRTGALTESVRSGLDGLFVDVERVCDEIGEMCVELPQYRISRG